MGERMMSAVGVFSTFLKKKGSQSRAQRKGEPLRDQKLSDRYREGDLVKTGRRRGINHL